MLITAERSQRENLRIPVVLVFVHCYAEWFKLGVPYSCSDIVQVPFIVVEKEIQSVSLE